MSDDKSGHRERLKNRFLKDNGQAMADYEILELLLSYAIPRRDVKPLAKELLQEFGSFSHVIYADYYQLEKIKGTGRHVITLLKLVKSALSRALSDHIHHKPLIENLADIIDYCRGNMRFEKIEQLRVLYLNTKQYIICDDLMHSGTIDQTPLYPREIVKRALDIGAAYIIIAHNHPSGDPSPSDNDIAITKLLQQALHLLDIQLYDHIIISSNTYYSFRMQQIIS